MGKIANKGLHDCVVQMMELEEKLLAEEMKDAQPHVFSREFEQKMQEVMRVQERVNKRSDLVRYLATAAVLILMMFGLLFVGNEDLHASEFKINILEWFEEFFVVENDSNSGKKDLTDILFDESQIGYIPEGFEKVEEEVTYSKVAYLYKNKQGEYINVLVYRNKTLSGIDNEEIEQDVKVDEKGVEYRYTYRAELNRHIFTWTDACGKFYFLSGSVNEEKMMEIMQSILR